MNTVIAMFMLMNVVKSLLQQHCVSSHTKYRVTYHLNASKSTPWLLRYYVAPCNNTACVCVCVCVCVHTSDKSSVIPFIAHHSFKSWKSIYATFTTTQFPHNWTNINIEQTQPTADHGKNMFLLHPQVVQVRVARVSQKEEEEWPWAHRAPP